MDPDLQGGASCILLQLLEEPPRRHGRYSKHQSKTTLERIEDWRIPKARVEDLSCSLLKNNLDIEVLKKAQVLVSAHIRETLDTEIVKWRTEADKWKIEVLKGVVFKMMKDIVALEGAAQELMHEVGQKNVEMEVLRNTAQDLMQEVGQKNAEVEALRNEVEECGEESMKIETVRREAGEETEWRVATTAKAKDYELLVESLQKQLAEKSKATEILEIRVKAAASAKAMTKKAKHDELRILFLQKQFAVEDSEATEVPDVRKIKALESIFGEKELGIVCKPPAVSVHELEFHSAVIEGNTIFVFDDEELPTENLEDLPAAKRAKRKGVAYDFTTLKVAGNEEEVAKEYSEGIGREDIPHLNDNGSHAAGNDMEIAREHSKENGGKDSPVVNDSGNHVNGVVGASSGGEEVNERFDQIPQQQRVASPTPSALTSDEDSDTVIVTDPEFHCFDAMRTENDILPGQIWAVFDDLDGMPRFYAQISQVYTKPFKALVNWLVHCAPTEEERVWTESTGLSITCGIFRTDMRQVIHQINSFSHFIMDSGGFGILKIYPKKGEVWAVYKDPEQGTGAAGGPRSHGGSAPKLEMVQIVRQLCDTVGVRTKKLVKVRGFKTVFRKQAGIASYRSMKPEELVKFSHRVPSKRIEDSETDIHGIPRGSLELDPASTPPDLIKDSPSLQIVHPE